MSMLIGFEQEPIPPKHGIRACYPLHWISALFSVRSDPEILSEADESCLVCSTPLPLRLGLAPWTRRICVVRREPEGATTYLDPAGPQARSPRPCRCAERSASPQPPWGMED